MDCYGFVHKRVAMVGIMDIYKRTHTQEYPTHTTHTHIAIRCLATTTNTHQHELVTWVHKHGGTVSPSINVVAWGGDDGGSGFGLGATDPVTSGTQLIMLPTALHLTFTEDDPPPAAAAESSPTARALRALVRQVPQELWGGKLALHLLAQRARGNGSKWAPYIRNLPVGFVGVPMFFAGDELSALHYPPVVEQVKKRCRWLLSFAGGALQEEGAVQDAFFGARIDANALGVYGGVVSICVCAVYVAYCSMVLHGAYYIQHLLHYTTIHLLHYTTMQYYCPPPSLY